MFKKNTDHVQKNLFGLFNTLPPSLQHDVKQSSEYHFYQLIFCNIPEELFAKLYSDKKSRPNAPINVIELIIRLHRVLSDADRQRFQEKFQAYINKTSGQYIYHLTAVDLPHELEKIGQLYYWIYENLYSAYAAFEIFKIFERVYTEHFTIVDDQLSVTSSAQLHSGCVQSPDDVDATYRDKNGSSSKGQAINVTETAHPDNPINLVTDVAVNANNIDDSQVLGERLDKIKHKITDLNELHFDGGFGSSANDEKFNRYDITPLQTAVRGRQAAVTIEIEQVSDDAYQVSWPQRHQCPAITMEKYKVFYFSHEDYLARRRQHRIHEISSERRTLRNNVEATVHEFVCKMPRKKLKVRGAFKAAVFAYSVAMAINFGGIYRLWLADPDYFRALFFVIFKIVNERLDTENPDHTLPPGVKWRFKSRCF